METIFTNIPFQIAIWNERFGFYRHNTEQWASGLTGPGAAGGITVTTLEGSSRMLHRTYALKPAGNSPIVWPMKSQKNPQVVGVRGKGATIITIGSLPLSTIVMNGIAPGISRRKAVVSLDLYFILFSHSLLVHKTNHN